MFSFSFRVHIEYVNFCSALLIFRVYIYYIKLSHTVVNNVMPNMYNIVLLSARLVYLFLKSQHNNNNLYMYFFAKMK